MPVNAPAEYFKAEEKFRLRYPKGHFWSRGYYASTEGITGIDVQINYVEKQVQHHNVNFL